MGWESVTQNTEVRGNTRPEPPPLGECASVLGRYAILCSTAPPPLRLSASRMPASVRTVGDFSIVEPVPLLYITYHIEFL